MPELTAKDITRQALKMLAPQGLQVMSDNIKKLKRPRIVIYPVLPIALIDSYIEVKDNADA